MADTDKLRQEAACIRDEVNENANTAQRVGNLLIQMVDALGSSAATGNLTGYVAVDSLDQLPSSPSGIYKTAGYLFDGNLYVFVGKKGDTAGGLYKNCGPFKGPKGDAGAALKFSDLTAEEKKELKGEPGAPGKKGDKGDQGNTGSSVAYPFELVNNLTEGGVDKALTAEQGKLINHMFEDLNYTDFSAYEIKHCWIRNTDYSEVPDNTIDCTGFIPCEVGDTFFYSGFLLKDTIMIAGYSDSNTQSFVDALLISESDVNPVKDARVTISDNRIRFIRAISVNNTYQKVKTSLSIRKLGKPEIEIRQELSTDEGSGSCVISQYIVSKEFGKVQLSIDEISRIADKDFSAYEITHCWIKKSGQTEVYDSTIDCTGFIPCEVGDTFFYSGFLLKDIIMIAGYSDSNTQSFVDALLISESNTNAVKDIPIVIYDERINFIRAISVNNTYKDVSASLKIIRKGTNNTNDINNVIDLSDFGITSAYLQKDGSIYSYTYSDCTSFIPVKKGDKFLYSGMGYKDCMSVCGYSSKDAKDPTYKVFGLLVGYGIQMIEERIVIDTDEIKFIRACSTNMTSGKAEFRSKLRLTRDYSPSNPSVPQGGDDKPDTVGLGNVLKRAYQWVYLKWRPKRFVPSRDGGNLIGVYNGKGNFSVSISDTSIYKKSTDTLFNKIDDVYKIIYSGGNWTFNGRSVSINSLGLEIAGSAMEGDYIIVRYSASLALGTSTFLPNVEVMGLPYGRTEKYQYSLGRVSFKTFMTALQNPNSKMYTENQNGPFYAGVCSTINAYAYQIERCDNVAASQEEHGGFRRTYAKIKHLSDISGQLKIGDTIWQMYKGAQRGHIAIVTYIKRNSKGEITTIYVTEEWPPKTIERTYTLEGFYNRWINPKTSGYPIVLVYRDDEDFNVDYEQSPYVTLPGETPLPVSYNQDLGLDKGEEIWYKKGETVQIAAYNNKYTEVIVSIETSGTYKEVKRIPISSFGKGYADTKVYDMHTTDMQTGDYKIVLSGSTFSEPIYFSLIETGYTRLTEKDTCQFGGYSSNLRPVCFCWRSANNNYMIDDAVDLKFFEIEKGECRITDNIIQTTEPNACIMFKYKYGYVTSDGVQKI